MLSCTPLATTSVRFPLGYYGAAYATFPSPSNGDVRCDDPQFIYRRRDNECDSVPHDGDNFEEWQNPNAYCNWDYLPAPWCVNTNGNY